MNKKGFAISGIIYSILILFLILVFSILAILGSRKLIIDKFKSEVMNKLNNVEEKLYSDNSGANPPVLLDNMIPVVYDGDNWVYANLSKKWYDYNQKEWANAVVLNTGIEKDVGEIITEDEISLWYVWIPRYKYTLFNVNNEGVSEQEIKIQFESGTSTTGTVSCSDEENIESCVDNTNVVVTNNVSTYTHPAFTFGSQQLTGFWVGKFEVSGTTDNITIKPNVSSLRNLNVSSFFTAIKNINENYNISGDSHMIKNIEWGAVAYLTQSKYGRCTNSVCEEVGINNNSNYITGCGAVAGSSESSTCNSYETLTGMFASTTGNIYGIYDMSGGAWDYVMGNMVDENGEFYVSSSGFSEAPNEKYYDIYLYDTLDKTHDRGKLGDATKETLVTFGSISGGWYGDYAYFPSNSDSWFIRGGIYSYGSNSGIFYFNRYIGYQNSAYSSRAVLSIN